MTQSGSFPDRPRGRRARHDSDPEREFPDLEPVRDPRLSEADNRGLPPGGRRGRHSAPADGQQPPDSPPAPYEQPYGQPGGPRMAAPYASGPYDAPAAGWGQQPPASPDSYQQPGYPGGGYAQQDGYAPQQDGYAQDYPQPPGRPAAPQPDEAGPGRRRRGGRGGAAAPPPAARRERSPWDEADDDEVTDDPMEAFSRRWARRGAEAPEDNRARRRWWIVAGSAAAAVIVAVAVTLSLTVFSSHSTSNVGFGSLVTTFLPGEIQSVPNACSSVSSSTLNSYLPGGRPLPAPPLNGGEESQCNWTLDSPPAYRVLEVEINAFSPSGLASGTGSATFAAIDAFTADKAALQKPAGNSGQPPATVTDISGLGQSAFSATQSFDLSDTVTFKATVLVRYHNVIVTVVINGLDKATTSKGSYGPESMTTLLAAARQVATEVTATVTK